MSSKKDIENRLLRNAMLRNIGNYVGPGSVLGELFAITAAEISDLENRSESNLLNSRIISAKGNQLDNIGRDLQLPRNNVQNCVVYASDRNVCLYTASGVLFDSLEGGLPTISRGSVLRTRDNKSYTVIETANLSGLNKAYIGVRGLDQGTSGNVNKGEISIHSISGYETSILVTNEYSIYNGTDRETDDAYRLRLLNRFSSFVNGTQSSVQNEILKLPGVGRFKIINNYKGSGTIGVVLQPTLGIRFNASQLMLLKNRISSFISSGTDVYVINPLYKHFFMSTDIVVSNTLTATQRVALKNRIRGSVLLYLNSIGIGESISRNEIKKAILKVSTDIKSVGKNNNIDVIGYRIYGDNENYYEHILNNDINTLESDRDELFILDESNPITINIV